MAIDPEVQLAINKAKEEVRKELHPLYAIKLVEKIVFYMVGAASLAVLGAVFKLVIL